MFWQYTQNNPGGTFDFDINKGVTHHVVIEAKSSKEADKRALAIGLYFNGCAEGVDCECCGDRWSNAWRSGCETPHVYDNALGVKVERSVSWMPEGYETAVHFMNGSIKWYAADNQETVEGTL